jgi:hypothetical protein
VTGRPDSIVGTYVGPAFDLEVVEGPTGLLLAFPGVPSRYLPRLAPTEDPVRFQVSGGPIAGAEVTFEMGAEGMILAAGPFRLVKAAAPEPPPYPQGFGLTLPLITDDPERDASFAALAGSLAGMDGGVVPWDLPYPKHEFVVHLMAEDAYMFHGSPREDIDEFAPRRTSLEIFDVGGHGNLGAVYATADAIWAMWFAVIDRSRLDGSIRSGVMAFDDGQGHRIRVYEFSVHHGHLPEPPMRSGMLYLLPRETFQQVPYYPGGPPSEEWASESPVRPIARLPVDPADFPFADRVGGHDDGDLIRYDHLSDLVEDATMAAEPAAGGFVLTVAASEELEGALAEYQELSSRFLPDVRREITHLEDGTLSIRVSGPPAYLHVVERGLERRGLLG